MDDGASMSGWTVSTLDSDEASRRSDVSLQSMMQEEQEDDDERSQSTLDTEVSSIAFGAPALGGGGPQDEINEIDDGGYSVSSIESIESIDEIHRITEVDDEERSFSSHNTISTIDSDEMSMISEDSQQQQQQQQQQHKKEQPLSTTPLSTTAIQMSQNDVEYEDKLFDDESSQLTGNSSEGYLHAYGKGDVNSFTTTDTLPMSDYSDEVTPVNLLHRAALLEKRSVLFHDSLRHLECNFSDDSSFDFDDDDDVFTYGDSETQTMDPTLDPTIEYLVQQEESENFWDHINTHGNDNDHPVFEHSQGGDLLTGMEIGHNILVPLKS
eukprot:scaffold567029_cov63-Attheya_sp.AAC.2